MSVCEAIKHYQRSIEKCNGDEKRILHCISKLDRLPVSVQHLQDTGVGRTVNGLRKFEGKVAVESKSLVAKWKAMVAEEESSASEEEQEEEPQSADEASDESVETVKEKDKPNSPEKHVQKTEQIQLHNNGKQDIPSVSDNKKHAENDKSSHRSHKRHRDENIDTHKSSKKSKPDLSNENSKKIHGSTSSSDNRDSHKTHHKHHRSSSSQKDKKQSDNSEKTLETKKETPKSKEEKVEKHSSSKSRHKSKSDDNKKKEQKKSSNGKEHKDKRKVEHHSPGAASSSGPSFEEALGFAAVKSPKKKSSSHQAVATTSKVGKPSATLETPKLLSPSMQLTPLNLDLSIIPAVSPNYRPMPYVEDVRESKMTMQNAVGMSISSKNQRTKVYSGNKGSLTHVPTLYEMCIRLLQENIDAVEYTGGVPYDILKPVLERASPEQLFLLEHHNPYLIEESDLLWEFHCNKKFRGKPRLEMEGWREMYLRCQDEQDAKLRSITANIKQSQDQSQPVRKAKMAFFDSAVKPPRNVARKQAQFGTAQKPVVTPAARVSALSGLISNIAKAGDSRLKVRPGLADNAQVSASSHKQKRAPLMLKTLSFMKGRFKR